VTSLSNFAQEKISVNPGIDRWLIKTSLITNPHGKTVALKELLSLPNPIKENSTKYEKSRIPIPVGNDSLMEGDLITTTGWIHLIALEDDAVKHRDGDYHIQVRASYKWGDTCLIVEVPYAKFVSDSSLRAKCEAIRGFLRSNFLSGQEPLMDGSKISPPLKVIITGQLFFDAVHLKTRPRGKKGIHSYTCWEIHPIVDIKFTP